MTEPQEDHLLDVAPGQPHSNILSETLAYVIGLALALILTGVSFWVASTGVLWGSPGATSTRLGSSSFMAASRSDIRW